MLPFVSSDDVPRRPRRALQSAEKLLLFACLLGALALAIVGWNRGASPGYDAQLVTPEIACQSLVRALLAQNEAQIKKLTTARGYATLQTLKKSSALDSHPKIGTRIFSEWGNSIFWENFSQRNSREDWGLTTTVRPDEAAPTLLFKRTRKGWKLDDYVPMPDRAAKRRMGIGRMWNLDE